MRPTPLQVADIESVLGAAVAGMLALELAVRLFLGLAFSSAATCASVSTRPPCALLASSALSRFIVSRVMAQPHAAHAAGETTSPSKGGAAQSRCGRSRRAQQPQ
jgi:hypothetical protein